MKKEIKFETEARNAVLEGINEISRAVQVTLGAKGKNVIIGNAVPRITKHGVINAPKVTKDGITVAESIEFENPYKAIGASMVKEVAGSTCDETGDGTTTATILFKAIINNGLKHVEAGASPIALREGMNLAATRIVAKMKDMSFPCKTDEEIKSVAIISANNDIALGEKVAEVMIKVGPQGIIDIQNSDTAETTISSTEGMKMDSGYISPYLITDPTNFTSVLENPLIFITDMKIGSLERIIPLMEIARESGRPLFIIGESFEGDVLPGLVSNHLNKKLQSCAIKSPGTGNNKKEILEDLAVLTGGVVFTDEKGLDTHNINIGHLGKCKKIITDQSSTTVIGGEGGEENLEARKSNIRKAIKAAKGDNDKNKLKDRLARLENGVAVIRVGANSDTELSEKKDRIEDSIGATTVAMEEGIVPGGGVALAVAGEFVKANSKDDDVNIGIKIIKEACQAPIRQLAKNCGKDDGVIYNKVIETGLGYNALTDEYEDLVESGVIDPMKVPKVALEKAVSVASQFLTTDVVIVDVKE